MKKVLAAIFIVFITLFWIACNKEIPAVIIPDGGDCLETVIDKQAYNNAGNSPYTLVNVFIINDCLLFNVQYAGGCGESNFQLFGSGDIMESEPVSTSLRLGFISNDPCEALITQNILFDLTAIQSLAEGEINLMLDGYEEKLLYIY